MLVWMLNVCVFISVLLNLLLVLKANPLCLQKIYIYNTPNACLFSSFLLGCFTTEYSCVVE